jgi:hypothetical protein
VPTVTEFAHFEAEIEVLYKIQPAHHHHQAQEPHHHHQPTISAFAV